MQEENNQVLPVGALDRFSYFYQTLLENKNIYSIMFFVNNNNMDSSEENKLRYRIRCNVKS